MTNEQILEQQVEALEKLLQLKQAIIDEQEAKINKLLYPQPIYTPGVQIGGGGGGVWIGGAGPGGGGYGGILGGQAGTSGIGGPSTTISIPSQWTITSWQCSDGHPHQYPTLSSGSVPCCTKCGTAYGSTTTISSSTGNIAFTGGAQQVTTTSMALDGISQSTTTISNNSTPTNVFTLTPAANK